MLKDTAMMKSKNTNKLDGIYLPSYFFARVAFSKHQMERELLPISSAGNFISGVTNAL